MKRCTSGGKKPSIFLVLKHGDTLLGELGAMVVFFIKSLSSRRGPGAKCICAFGFVNKLCIPNNSFGTHSCICLFVAKHEFLWNRNKIMKFEYSGVANFEINRFSARKI